MEVLHWFPGDWLELIEAAGIVGGLLFSAYTTRQDEKARRIGNLISINEQHSRLWRELYERPGLSRILKKDVDLRKQPVTDEELLFVKMLILHLGVVRRAMKEGMFVRIEGMREDIRQFFASPVPKTVWEKLKPFQDGDFVAFIEDCLHSSSPMR
jgi:hypothetical protein